MDGFRHQSLSDTTKNPSTTNRSMTLFSTVAATSSSPALHFNPNRTPPNPIHPFIHSAKFQQSIPPSAGSTSKLGVSSSGIPPPMNSSTSSYNYFPSSSKALLKEERSCSSISFSSSSASDSDYDSAPLKSSATLQRQSAKNDPLMASQRYGPTCVTMGNDEELLFKEDTTTRTEDESRKRIRRERNKQAAARCRQRRVDLTNNLMEETETLDTVRADLQRQVEDLVRQKNQLEFVLQAHTTQCRMVHPSSSSPGSIPQFVKLESSDTSFLRPPSTSSQAAGSTTSSHLHPHCQQQQMGPSTLNSSHQRTAKGVGNQMTSMTFGNHMPLTTSANHTSSMTSLSDASSINTILPMSCATMTLPTTSDVLLVSPMTFEPLSSFDFGFDILSEAQGGHTRVAGVPSSSSTGVMYNYGEGISPTLLNL